MRSPFSLARRARLAVVAVGAVVAVTAGSLAYSAQAAPVAPLTISGSTTIGVLDLDRNASADNALGAYGVRVNGLPADAAPRIQLVSAPLLGVLQFEGVAGTAAPTPTFTALTRPDETLVDVTAPLTLANRGVVYLGATVAGNYQVRVFDDQDGDQQYTDGEDASTPVIAIRVYDVTNPRTSVNDWRPAVTYTAAPKYGQRVRATIGYGGLTSVDARGKYPQNDTTLADGTAGKPVLGWNAVGRHLQLQLNGAGYPGTRRAPCTIVQDCSWFPVTGNTSSVWYIVPRRPLSDRALSDNLSFRVRLDPARGSGATWSTSKVNRVVTY